MKTVSSGLKSHLQSDTTTLCTCWTVTRTDGTILNFTDHDQDIIISGVTYHASNTYTRSALKYDSAINVDNMEIVGMLDNAFISDQDLANGLYDYAKVNMFLCNWRNLSQGIMKLRAGWLGEVTRTPTGVFKVEFRGLAQALTTQWGDLFSPLCRHDLGDSKCTVNVPAITHTGTVATVTNHKTFSATAPLIFTPFAFSNIAAVYITSTAPSTNTGLGIVITINGVSTTFTAPTTFSYTGWISWLTAAVNAAHIGVTAAAAFGTVGGGGSGVSLTLNDPTQTGLLDKVNDTHNYLTPVGFSEGYMNKSALTWLTGNNAGVAMEVKSYYQPGATLTLYLNMKHTIQAGDTFSYYPGCDKRRETCWAKFNNAINFGGEPDMPGMDALLTYPDAMQK